MYTRSREFDKLVSKSHTALSRVDVLKGGGVAFAFQPIEGAIQVDRNADARRRITCRLLDEDGVLAPKNPSDILAPFGTFIQVYRGLRHSMGDELLPVGYFDIQTVKTSESEGVVVIEIIAQDLTRYMKKKPFSSTVSYTPAAFSPVGLIEELVRDADASITVVRECPIGEQLTNQNTANWTFKQGEDRWKAINDIAEAIGCEVFFDVTGQLIIRDATNTPSTQATADWTYEEGERAMILGVEERTWDDKPDEIFNHIIVREDNPAKQFFPAFGEAKDNNPLSPTYVGGDFGDRIKEVSNPFVTSNDQANQLAKKLLLQHTAFHEQITFPVLVHPAHEAGDTIIVNRSRSGVEGSYTLETFTVPLKAVESSTITAKKRVF